MVYKNYKQHKDFMYYFCVCTLLYNYRKNSKPSGFVIMSTYGQNRNISVNFIAHLLNTQQNFVEGNRTVVQTFQTNRFENKKRTVQNSTRMQMNASFCRELDPSKFHSSLEIPDPTTFPIHSIRCQESCAKPYLDWLVAILSCMCLWYKKQNNQNIVCKHHFCILYVNISYSTTPPTPRPLLNEVPKKDICQSHLLIQSTDSVAYIFSMFLCTFRVSLKS